MKGAIMRNLKLMLIVIMSALTLSIYAAGSGNTSLRQLSRLLKKGATPNVKLEKKEKAQIEKLLVSILPDKKYIGDKEWKVVYHDMNKGDFFQVDLKKKGDKSFARLIWFHILYKQEKPKFYGSENFGKYRGMGMKNRHYFILVGKVEIRAVAASDEYKNDKKIKSILKAFKLKDIEKL